MIIYLDIAFFVNLAMNFSVFYITKKFLKLEVGDFRIFLGSFLSAIVYVASLFFGITFLGFVSLICGLLVSFGKKQILKTFIYAHATAFLIGGMALALYNYGILQNFSFVLLVLSTSGAYVFLVFIKKMRKEYFTIEIQSEGKKIKFKALLDTGNTLTYENKSVVVIDYGYFEKTSLLIPYKTITEEGYLKGFIPENTTLNGRNITIVVAVSEVILSSKNDFNALIGSMAT